MSAVTRKVPLYFEATLETALRFQSFRILSINQISHDRCTRDPNEFLLLAERFSAFFLYERKKKRKEGRKKFLSFPNP